jgi:hypothetical protein
MAEFANVQPPNQFTEFDSVIGWEWASRLTNFVQGVAKLGDTQVFNGVNRFNKQVLIQKGQPIGGLPEAGQTPQLMVERVENADATITQNIWALQAIAYVTSLAQSATSIVGGEFNAFAGKGGGVCWGIATEAGTGTITTGSTAASGLCGAECAVISQYDNNTLVLVGINAVFKNRPDGVAQPFNGLGSNKYNNNSRAIYIDSQSRSGLGEFCGWSSGIFFETDSMDATTGGAAVLIDGSRVPVSRATVGLWVADNVQVRLSNTANYYMRYRSSTSQVVIANTGTDFFGIDMTSGAMYLNTLTQATVGAAGAASALPATPLGYWMANINGVSVSIPFYNQ